MAFTQAFGQAATGSGNMAGLFIPAPGTVDERQAANASTPSAGIVSTFLAAAVMPGWNDGGPSALTFSPSNKSVWELTGQRSSASPTSQFQQAASVNPAPQPVSPLMDRLNADPHFAQQFADHINAILAVRDQGPSQQIDPNKMLVASADGNKINETNQGNYARALDASAAHAEIKQLAKQEGDAAKAGGPQGKTGGPAPQPAPAAAQDAFIRIAATGMGSFSGNSSLASSFKSPGDADAMPSGYSGTSANTSPAAPSAPTFNLTHPDHPHWQNRVTTDGTAAGLRIDGQSLEQLGRSIGNTLKVTQRAAESVDDYARGVNLSLSEAHGLVSSNQITANQINAPASPNTGTVTVRPLVAANTGPSPGRSGFG